LASTVSTSNNYLAIPDLSSDEESLGDYSPPAGVTTPPHLAALKSTGLSDEDNNLASLDSAFNSPQVLDDFSPMSVEPLPPYGLLLPDLQEHSSSPSIPAITSSGQTASSTDSAPSSATTPLVCNGLNDHQPFPQPANGQIAEPGPTAQCLWPHRLLTPPPADIKANPTTPLMSKLRLP